MYFSFTLKSPGERTSPGSPIRAPVIREDRLQGFCASKKNSTTACTVGYIQKLYTLLAVNVRN